MHCLADSVCCGRFILTAPVRIRSMYLACFLMVPDLKAPRLSSNMGAAESPGPLAKEPPLLAETLDRNESRCRRRIGVIITQAWDSSVQHKKKTRRKHEDASCSHRWSNTLAQNSLDSNSGVQGFHAFFYQQLTKSSTVHLAAALLGLPRKRRWHLTKQPEDSDFASLSSAS